MPTIDAQHKTDQPVDGSTLRGIHHAVRDARGMHCRHGRADTAHCGRRPRRRQLSQYRAVNRTAFPITVRGDDPAGPGIRSR